MTEASRVTVKVPEEQAALIERMAALHGRTPAEIITDAFATGLSVINSCDEAEEEAEGRPRPGLASLDGDIPF